MLREPEDVTTTSGATVTFLCEVSGDPDPTITWFREESDDLDLGGRKLRPLPKGRTVVKEGMLIIENVTPKDEGLYVCEAKNEVGMVRLTASLAVHG